MSEDPGAPESREDIATRWLVEAAESGDFGEAEALMPPLDSLPPRRALPTDPVPVTWAVEGVNGLVVLSTIGAVTIVHTAPMETLVFTAQEFTDRMLAGGLPGKAVELSRLQLLTLRTMINRALGEEDA